MSGYKGHIAGGLAAGLLYTAALSQGSLDTLLNHQGTFLSGWYYIGALLVLASAFGIWPDVDTNSKAQDIFFALLFALDIVLLVNGRMEASAYVGLIGMLPILGKHRGWTHSWGAMVAIPSLFIVIPYMNHPARPWSGLPYFGAAIVGYFSHLVLDGRLRHSIKHHHHHAHHII